MIGEYDTQHAPFPACPACGHEKQDPSFRTAATEVRRFPPEKIRVETGAIRFGNDWSGVFIRGDDARRWEAALRVAVMVTPGIHLKASLRDLMDCLGQAAEESQ